MGSGNWPIGEFDVRVGLYDELLLAIKALKEANRTMECDSCQFDNAASDGWYQSRFSLAIELIESCITKRSEDL